MQLRYAPLLHQSTAHLRKLSSEPVGTEAAPCAPHSQAELHRHRPSIHSCCGSRSPGYLHSGHKEQVCVKEFFGVCSCRGILREIGVANNFEAVTALDYNRHPAIISKLYRHKIPSFFSNLQFFRQYLLSSTKYIRFDKKQEIDIAYNNDCEY